MATAAPAPARSPARARLARIVQGQGALVALVLLVLFGALRYDNFLSFYNVTSFLANNAKFGLIALGMTFVIMTGGIDLSVGAVAALASVVAAMVSDRGLVVGIAVPVLVGVVIGLVNGALVAWGRLQPFIVTLAMLLAARGLALTVAGNQSVSVDFDSGFTALGTTTLLRLAAPIWIFAVAYLLGILVLGRTPFSRHVLAVGDNEETARLMGLPAERVKLAVYAMSGGVAGMAGVLLAAQYGAGQPAEGVGWELTAIAAVVVGGTLLTGGLGSVAGTLWGVLLLGLIFNVLNFENGRGVISLSPYWQSIVLGAFLLVVVLLQNRLASRRTCAPCPGRPAGRVSGPAPWSGACACSSSSPPPARPPRPRRPRRPG
jgi:galactofuranose transport system permease protein